MHPSPELIVRAVQRQGAEAERLRTLEHIGSCAACRKEFELLRATHLAARQLTPTTWRVRGFGLAAAAAVVVAVTLSVFRSSVPHPGATPLDRGAAQQATNRSIALVGPLGSTSPTGPRFVWRGVATTGTYHLEVLDDSGGVALRADTPDTTYPALPLAPDRSYRWWVKTTVNGEAWQSEFGEIHTTAGGVSGP
jgi:hypothetical protein